MPTGTAEEDAAAAKMQAIQRGNLERKAREEEKAAAIKVQAIQRGNTARKGAVTSEEAPAEAPAAEAPAAEVSEG